MKRRTFCTSALAATGAAAWPFHGFSAVLAADVSAVTGEGRRVALARSDIEDLRAGLRGQLLLPESAGYDDARKVWNGMIDRKPALIVRCAAAADVARAVDFARAYSLLVAVRAGGHSMSGQSVCDDGLMIDLAPMRRVRIEAARRRARVEAGALLGDLDREALANGFVTPTGTVSHTGAAGLTLSGGFGRLGRRFGLSCDNVTTFDIVTANGRLRQASESENADLSWALRGGGGNFGVVTSLEYRLHPFDGMAVGGHLVYPVAQARALLENYAEHWAHAVDELWIEALLAATPAGERVAVLDVCYSGKPESAEAAIAPYRIGKPLHDSVKSMRFTELQTKDDERTRHGRRYYTKSGFVKALEPPLIDAILEAFASAPIRNPRIALVPKGGAINRVPRDATAFWQRDALVTVLVQANGETATEDTANTEWVRTTWNGIQPFVRGFYANFAGAEQFEQGLQMTYGENLTRLTSLKTKYDPENLFRLNANIKPAGRQAPAASR